MPPGRPRCFDVDKALDCALDVFWRKGYEGTTLPDLTRAMGINRPSLYAAFGNKEALFKKAIDRYAEGPGCHVNEALAEPTARRVIERLLLGTVDLLTNRRHPHGCFMVQGALACGDSADPIRRELVKRRAAGEAALRGARAHWCRRGLATRLRSGRPGRICRYHLPRHGRAGRGGRNRADLMRSRRDGYPVMAKLTTARAQAVAPSTASSQTPKDFITFWYASATP